MDMVITADQLTLDTGPYQLLQLSATMPLIYDGEERDGFLFPCMLLEDFLAVYCEPRKLSTITKLYEHFGDATASEIRAFYHEWATTDSRRRWWKDHRGWVPWRRPPWVVRASSAPIAPIEEETSDF